MYISCLVPKETVTALENRKKDFVPFIWPYLKIPICEFRIIWLDHITYDTSQNSSWKSKHFPIHQIHMLWLPYLTHYHHDAQVSRSH